MWSTTGRSSGWRGMLLLRAGQTRRLPRPMCPRSRRSCCTATGCCRGGRRLGQRRYAQDARLRVGTVRRAEGGGMGILVKAPPNRLPDADALSSGLSAVLGVGRSSIRILDRTPAIWASTYPSEVVTCAVGGSSELKLYCKYMAGLEYESFGHRGGVPYEIEVYRHVLAGLPVSLPTFY